MKIGFHLPISKGFDWTLKEAIRLQCDVIQIFVKNPRSWTKKEWKNEEIDDFKVLSDTVPVIAHLSYLPNLAKIDLDERHMNGFMHEVELCRQLGIDNLVIHCGSRANKEKGVKMVAEAINRAHEEYDISIVLENSSGQGESIGNNIDELLQIYECTRHKHKVFLCIDTAHIYQAGYDIRTKKGLNMIKDEIEKNFGDDKIALFHLNDSKTKFGSRADRHWHIGQGDIGISAFKFILGNKKFAHLYGIMETPKMGRMDEENMKIMRSLLSPLMPRSSS